MKFQNPKNLIKLGKENSVIVVRFIQLISLWSELKFWIINFLSFSRFHSISTTFYASYLVVTRFYQVFRVFSSKIENKMKYTVYLTQLNSRITKCESRITTMFYERANLISMVRGDEAKFISPTKNPIRKHRIIICYWYEQLLISYIEILV